MSGRLYVVLFGVSYHLIDLDTSRYSYSSFRRCMFIFSVQIQYSTAIKFQKCFCLTLFQKFDIIIWNNLGLSN